MPKRTDLKKILLIGSGPIVIGQACEFDYSGTQACKALREEGYEVVLANSNHPTAEGKATALAKFRPRVFELLAKEGESLPADPNRATGAAAFYDGPLRR